MHRKTLVLASMKLKPANMAYLWMEEGLLYTKCLTHLGLIIFAAVARQEVINFSSEMPVKGHYSGHVQQTISPYSKL